MTDVCIVCLGELRISSEHGDKLDVDVDVDVDVNVSVDDAVDAQAMALSSAPLATLPEQSKDTVDDEVIAHLLPCCHNLHDSCLRPWVERANSCPICRAAFHLVELRNYLDGPAHSSYAVQEKQQQADVDSTLLVDDVLFDEEEPCLVCGSIDNGHETMYCDACDGTVHLFCAGFDTGTAPDLWYCGPCAHNMESTAHAARRNAPRQPHARSRRGRHASGSWERVWATVWHRLNLDLDFPYDDDTTAVHRTPTQRRELAAWNRRLHVASRQGGANRFRDTASTLLDRRDRPAAYEPESQDELRAWNAFDKAKQLNHDQRPPSSRKRKSTTASPASPREQTDPDQAEPERKLKRPRTRRNQIVPEPGPSTTIEVPLRSVQAPVERSAERPIERPIEGPSFLTQLLQEVEKQPAPTEPSSPDAEAMSGDDQQIPFHTSSPGVSPIHSGHVSPRASSVTPPPFTHPRPSSPTPLTSIVRPLIAPVFSPVSNGKDVRGRPRQRPQAQVSSPPRDISPGSPSRNMSYSTKTEIQRMVKAALGPRYRNQEITKDQYTDINRDVSRKLYEKIGDAEGLADQKEREKWQEVAVEEVEHAIQTIRSQEEQSTKA